MCIYCATNNYRKIYENHYGPIPREENGRTYEIHHVDGNHSNNNPTNLVAVTLQEHYDIHYSQKDYAACYYMTIQRLNASPEALSELSRKMQLARVDNGTHPFLTRADGSSLATDRILNQIKYGPHPFLTRADGSSLSSDRVKDGTHNWLDGKSQRKYQQMLVKEQKNNFQKEGFISSSTIYLCCLGCKKITNLRGFGQGHRNKCSTI
jgi:hypothetical protein